MSLFVDTSVWYAAADSSDADNSFAKAALLSGESLVTTDHVLIEAWSLIHHRIGTHAAKRFWEVIRDGAASVEIVGAGDLNAAWQIGEEFPDQDFSIVDRTSFAVMRRVSLTRVASLDSDFAIFRFGAGKRHAFTIIR